ncbi:radical SAM protein [Clostridium sp. VAP23]|uniref:radical SAM protein n=1 Tax=Clostridium sp. VAP23 TaxID=2949981 RepID=UPI00207AE435|nr:radical SAM protein [Clostridium sp. VAP23]
MKIGLIDVDGHNFPNLALMKISAYHKSLGDEVEWFFGFSEYDKVYMSKVFTFTDDFMQVINAKEIIKGGTGYDLKNILPKEIENIYPDYSLYGVKEAYGYLTRGCPRGCKFCIVAEKEGQCSKKVADLNQFWNGQKEIKLLDPNILACKDWQGLFQQLIDSKAYVDFTQGLDIRLMTEEKAKMLNKIKVKMIHFAWDNYEFETYEKLKQFRPLLNFNGRKLRVYVLTNFNTTFAQDLERIYKLKELDYDPYVMIYEKWKAPKNIKQLQRWVNSKFIFRSCEKFEDYIA